MGPDQLSGVMQEITRASAKKSGATLDEAKLQARVQKFRESVQRDSGAYWTSAHLLDDGIIDPRDTRDVLGFCLEVVQMKDVKGNPASKTLARM
jgi:acetyl-CoA carboxylase carboxyltransferase component